jgi:hypothetical protein
MGAMQTYRIVSPPDATVVSACERVGCPHWRDGWDTIVDEASQLGQAQAAYIRSGATGRSYRETRTEAGLTVFRFEAHQRCFQEHRTRTELYLVRGGDWRGNPDRMARDHSRPEDWVEDFAEHQQRLADRIDKG